LPISELRRFFRLARLGRPDAFTGSGFVWSFFNEQALVILQPDWTLHLFNIGMVGDVSLGSPAGGRSSVLNRYRCALALKEATN
jgi:hypothetical protein